MDLPLQFRTDDITLILDGRVVEFFLTSGSEGERFHVDHFAVDARPDGDGLKIRFGARLSNDSIVRGGKATVPQGQLAEFQAFIAAAMAIRLVP